MASPRQILIIIAVAVYCETVVASVDDFNLHLDDLLSCKDVCDKYAFPSGERGDMRECCARGCRFFSILSFLHPPSDTNTTVHSCAANCDEAYSRQADRQACQRGCQGSRQSSQGAVKEDLPQEEEEASVSHMMYPVLYMHALYSNMLFKVHRHVELHWSLFTQPDSGELVVLRSQPIRLQADTADVKEPEGGPSRMDLKTSANLETNIAGQDNSATPILTLRSSQIGAAHPPHTQTQGLQLEEDHPAGASDGREDLWFCTVKKMDVARVVLCALILVSVVIMMWVCLTSSPSTLQQTLRVNGDLDDYLHSIAYKDSFQLLHPQDRVESCPLPIKIRVERV